MFDKILYWKRRKDGLRGQGDKLNLRRGVAIAAGPSTKPVSAKAIRKNSKRARKAVA